MTWEGTLRYRCQQEVRRVLVHGSTIFKLYSLHRTCPQLPNRGINTSNACESFHSKLKKNDLSGRPIGRVTDLVRTLVDNAGRQLLSLAVHQSLPLVTPKRRRELSSKARAMGMLKENPDAVFHIMDDMYAVQSESTRETQYEVLGSTREEDEVLEWTCNCRFYKDTSLRCKHIW